MTSVLVCVDLRKQGDANRSGETEEVKRIGDKSLSGPKFQLLSPANIADANLHFE